MGKSVIFVIMLVLSSQLNMPAKAYTYMDREIPIHELFNHDWNSKNVRYFHFGIAPIQLSPEVRHALKERYHITYQSMGCMVDKKYMMYNQMVDDNLKKEYNKSLVQIIKELKGEFPDDQQLK